MKSEDFQWVCDNPKKIGKHIYDIKMEDFSTIPSYNSPQIVIVVTSPSEKIAIRNQLENWHKEPGTDYWFFL